MINKLTKKQKQKLHKKVLKNNAAKSQQEYSYQSTIYWMGCIVLFLLFVFWVQLKTEIQDQGLLYSKDRTHQISPQKNQNIQPVSQNDNIINEADVNQIQKMLNGTVQGFQFQEFFYWSVENWDNKNQLQEKEKQKTVKQNSMTNRYIPPNNHPFNYYPSSTKTTTLPPNPYQYPTTVTPSAALRAGIKPQQIDLAKRLMNLKNTSPNSDLAQQQRRYYEQKYNISKYDEQPFCIVIPSYNNSQSERYISNINSILQQQYSNYHIVFIDDASEDGTGKLMQQFARNHQISQQKLKIIINQNRTMAMPNIYRAANQFCEPYQIFMIVDGDDELIGRQVLKHINSIYQTQQKWVVYTNFLSIRGSIGYSRPYSQIVIQNNSFRKAGFVISHLRSFYTKLLRLVKEQDLKDDQRNWFRAANDVAMYIPILQMTHKRLTYIPQISYMYNSNTGLNNHRVKLKQQKANQKKVKSRKSYQQLGELFTEQQKEQLRNSLNNKKQIKDLSLPQPSSNNIKVYGWEQE